MGQQFGVGVGLGVGNQKMRKLTQYQWSSAEPPKADIAERDRHVCFVPKADIDRSVDCCACSTIVHRARNQRLHASGRLRATRILTLISRLVGLANARVLRAFVFYGRWCRNWEGA